MEFAHLKGIKPVGYEALIRRFSLNVFPHYVSSFVTEEKGRQRTYFEGYRKKEVYPKTYDPGDTIGDHLVFALKYEGVSLEILSLLFQKVSSEDIEKFIRKTPTGKYARKIWFLYEFLTGKELDLQPVKATNYIDLLEEDDYFTANGKPATKQKIANNLLGDNRFCPMVRKNKTLLECLNLNLEETVKEVIKKYPASVLQRALSYLYTKETKTSFEIERATPDQKRAAKFVDLLKIAEDKEFFTRESLIELQRAIVDERFANSNFRTTQNYVGQTVTVGSEIIHFISPKPEDIPELMDGMFYTYENMMNSKIHPVIVAAVISFGFVFMHPFDDGNGRIHRFLIHNILAKRRFTPEGIIFPISATLLREIKEYDATLELFSKPLVTSLVDYELDDNGVMTVNNETAVYYRYIDMTPIVVIFFGFVKKTVEEELVAELDYLLDYDKAKTAIRGIVDMPDRLVDLFIRLCYDNNGKLSKTKRQSFFEMLTNDEITEMEESVQNAFKRIHVQSDSSQLSIGVEN